MLIQDTGGRAAQAVGTKCSTCPRICRKEQDLLSTKNSRHAKTANQQRSQLQVELAHTLQKQKMHAEHAKQPAPRNRRGNQPIAGLVYQQITEAQR
jgi:hypothetical protein